MYRVVKQRVFEILEASSGDDRTSRLFDLTIMILIFLNIGAVIFETVDSISEKYSSFFYYFELSSVIIFSIEYILRLWTAPLSENYKGSIKGRLKYIFSPMAIIDILAIAPFYLPLFVSIDLRIIRSLRFIRLFRIFKLGRYSRAFKILSKVVHDTKEELMLTTFTSMLLLLIASTVIYFLEKEIQPDVFSSIPASMWWGIATLTTVGYGDIYPVTMAGKLFGGIIAFLGIGMIALPAGIIGSGFSEAIKGDKSSDEDRFKDEKLEIATKLRDRGLSNSEIIEITGIDLENIDK